MLANVRSILVEFVGSIGDEGSAAEADRERQRVNRMLAALGQENSEAIARPAEVAADKSAPSDSKPTGASRLGKHATLWQQS